MPPPGLNLNEYGTESGFNAPQARKFPFLGQKVSKVFAMLPFPINFALGGQMIASEFLGDGMAPWPSWIRLC